MRGFVYFEIPAGRQLVEAIYEPLFSLNKARISLAVSCMVAGRRDTHDEPVAGGGTREGRVRVRIGHASRRSRDGTQTAVPSECTAEAAAARVTESVALVRTVTGLGTAFYIGDSTWLTAAHVVAGETSVRLTNDAIDIQRDGGDDVPGVRPCGARRRGERERDQLG